MFRRFFPRFFALVGMLGFSMVLGGASTAGVIAESPRDFSCSDVTEIPQIECEALVALYESTDGDNWKRNTDWLQTTTPCSWIHVRCESGHVWKLFLDGNQLTGSIPPELGNLINLQRLNLNANQLTGSIPSELGNLGNMSLLLIGVNQLTGSIPPELGNLDKLEELYLYRNQLTGSIPPKLGNLSNLWLLWLYENQLTGSIPPELGNLSNLQWLILHNNQLTGGIPPELGDLEYLAILRVNDNLLSGSLPMELINIPFLWSFWFHNTNLCEPNFPSFQAWLARIDDVQSTGVICQFLDIYLPVVLAGG